MAEGRTYGVNQSAMIRIGLQVERSEAQVKGLVKDIANVQKVFGKDLPATLKKAEKDVNDLAKKLLKGLFPDEMKAKASSTVTFLKKEFDKLTRITGGVFATKAEKDRYLAMAEAIKQITNAYKGLGAQATASASQIRASERALQSAITRGAAGVRANEMAYASRMASGLISPTRMGEYDQMRTTAQREMEATVRGRQEALAQTMMQGRVFIYPAQMG